MIHALRDGYFQQAPRDNHEPELSEWKFSDAMKEHGYAKLPRSKQGVQYQGVRIANQPVEATIGDMDTM
jgi:hypothetical protein